MPLRWLSSTQTPHLPKPSVIMLPMEAGIWSDLRVSGSGTLGWTVVRTLGWITFAATSLNAASVTVRPERLIK